MVTPIIVKTINVGQARELWSNMRVIHGELKKVIESKMKK